MRPILFFCCLFYCAAATVASLSDRNHIPGDSSKIYLEQARILKYEDFSKTLSLLKKAENIATQASYLADVYHEYAALYYVKGEYDISLQNYLKAAKIYREESDKFNLAKCFVGQGLIQQGINRHEAAVNLFQQAIEFYRLAGKHDYAGPAYVNIAISEIDRFNYVSAEEHLHTAIDLAQRVGRTEVIHLSLSHLGLLAFIDKDFKKALDFYNRVLQHELEPHSWNKSFAHAGLSEVYLAQKKFPLALKHAQAAMNFAEKSKSLWDLDRNTDIIYQIYAATGDYEKALNYLELNKKYRDSLYDQLKLREINLLQLKSKEAENLRLQLEKQKTESALLVSRGFMALLLIMVLLLVGLLFIYNKNIKQKVRFNELLQKKNRKIVKQNRIIKKINLEQQELIATKNKLFSILSHDLRSPIGSIEQILGMIKSGEFTDAEIADLLDEMLIQVSGTSLMLHNLLHWANTQMDGVKVNSEKINLPQKMEKVLAAYHIALNHKNIRLIHTIAEGKVEILGDRGQISVIIHNLISNAIKFTPENGNIEINYKEEEKTIKLSILNSGKLLSEHEISRILQQNSRLTSQKGTKMESGTGLGLLLIKEFLAHNKASLDIQSHPGRGTEFSIKFIKAASAV